MDQLASLLLTAERASSSGAVTIDLFPREEDAPGRGELLPLWAGPSPIGRLVAERGRVCWVMAKGCDLTVSDVLAAETGIGREQLEQVYEVACHEGSPFCETLAHAGLVSPEDVRNALLRRTAAGAAALARMESGDGVVMSVARIPRLSYEERFTYGAVEIIAAVVRTSKEWEEELGELPPPYVAVADRLEAALCFRESGGADLSVVPVTGRSADSLPLGDALDLAMAGLAAAQPPDPVLAEIAPFTIIPGKQGDWWLTAYSAPHLCLFQINTPDEYRQVLAALLAAPKQSD